MEEGLEVPAFERAMRWETNAATARRRKNEGARVAVNATAGNGPSGDANQREHEIRHVHPPLSAEGKLRRAGTHRGESCFATGGNAVNPMIGSGLKYGHKVAEEQTVEVARNHEDGTRMGDGSLISKGAEGAAATQLRRLPGDGLHGRNDGGAIFGQPQERNPALRPGR